MLIMKAYFDLFHWNRILQSIFSLTYEILWQENNWVFSACSFSYETSRRENQWEIHFPVSMLPFLYFKVRSLVKSYMELSLYSWNIQFLCCIRFSHTHKFSGQVFVKFPLEKTYSMESEVAQSYPTLGTPWIVACARLIHPWDFLGKSTGVDCRFLLQGIFPTQGSNPGLPHCKQMLYCLSHQGKQHLIIGLFYPIYGNQARSSTFWCRHTSGVKPSALDGMALMQFYPQFCNTA